MTDFIRQYFFDQENADSIFNSHATEEQISELESVLGLQLPEDYKDFLRTMNGFEGEVGETLVIFEPVEHIEKATQNNCAEFFSWAIFIGSNGNLEMFVIDKRSSQVQFGLLPYIADDNDFIPLGTSFEHFLKRLKEGTAFQRQ
jgi:cell wall assembly regulator SMI1